MPDRKRAETMSETVKHALIMEGGAMRGLFTCGVIDVFLEEGIEFDAVNENLPEVLEAWGFEDTRKIFAHQYWDDSAVIPSEYMDMDDILEVLK